MPQFEPTFLFYNRKMDALTELADKIAGQKSPPVHLWKPEQQGEIDIHIDAQGFWFHEGDPIQRSELVQLFASILWHENQQHYLVTPDERLAITVEDVPFVIQQMHRVEGHWVAVNNLHQETIISAQNRVELRPFTGQPIPYINLRYDLWARVNRSIYYQWVTEAMEKSDDGAEALTLKSGDYQFKVADVP